MKRRFLEVFAIVIVLAVSTFSYDGLRVSAAGNKFGKLTSQGEVFVDGLYSSSSSILNGSAVKTTDSDAVVDLGKLGQVFIAKNSELKLFFVEDNSVKVDLSAGSVRLQKNDQSVKTLVITPTSQILDGKVVSADNSESITNIMSYGGFGPLLPARLSPYKPPRR